MTKDINNMWMDEDERITAYLKGKMSATEETQFIIELQNNPELKAKAVAMARLVKGMKEVGTKRDMKTKEAFLVSTQEEVKQMARNVSAERKAKLLAVRQISIWMSLAASIILIVWGGFIYNDYRTTMALADEYAMAFETSIYSRGEEVSSEAEQKLAQLFDNVKNKKELKNTLHDLSLCWEISQMETYNDYTVYSAEIGWYLTIGYLNDNDRKNAKIVLERLVVISEEGSAISQKAKELLGKIQ